jgi:hypothetical protein
VKVSEGTLAPRFVSFLSLFTKFELVKGFVPISTEKWFVGRNEMAGLKSLTIVESEINATARPGVVRNAYLP